MNYDDPLIIKKIEAGFKWLAENNLSSFERYYPYLFLASLIFLLWAIYGSVSGANKLVHQLGYTDKGNCLKIAKNESYVELRGIKATLLNKPYWRDQFEILENVFDRKFIDVRFAKKYLSPSVRLIYDRLPKVVTLNQCPDLKPMESWFGKNHFGNDVVVNLQESPALYIDGKPGAGKTIAVKAVLNSYLKGIKSDCDVVVVTTKPADYFDLKQNKKISLILINPYEGEFVLQAQNILNEIEKLKELENRFKLEINMHPEIDSSKMNLEGLRSIHLCEDVKRKFFIFDEAKDYLSKSKSDSKQDSEMKQQLISAVFTHIRRTARFLSIPIIVASQTQNERDLDIPLKMFHLRLASSTNEAMSRIICGDKRLTDLSFKKGKFFLRTDTQDHVLKMPLI